MKRVTLFSVFSCVIAVAALAPPSFAQSYRTTSATRGSAGPSTFVGTLGGDNTLSGVSAGDRGRGGNSFMPRFGRARGGFAPDGINRIGGYGVVSRFETNNNIFVAPIRTVPSSLGYFSPYSRYSAIVPSGTDEFTLRSLSGRTAAEDFSLRFGQVLDYAPPQLQSGLLLPREEPQNVVQAFFGLIPDDAAQPRAADDRSAPAPLMADLMGEVNRIGIAQLGEQARQQFRDAMVAGDDRAEKLLAAQTTLSTMSAMDRSSVLPVMLTLHVAMERRQTESAARAIFDLVERNPAVFSERPDLAAFFPDPQRLRKSALEWIEFGRSPDPSVGLIQAYCAWLLGDAVRVEQTLDHAASVARMSAEAAAIARVKLAMMASFQVTASR